MHIFDLKNKVAIVTGGYGHIGSALVIALENQGAQVIVAGRDKNKYDERFREFNSPNIYFKKIDIGDSTSIKRCFHEVNEEFNSIDILINNAHFLKGIATEGITDQDWSYTMEGILGSVYKGIREVIPYMRKNGSGKIINISSMYGVVSPKFSLYEGDNCEKFANPPHYGAGKAGVIQLTKYYASVLGKENIQVNSVTPGPFPKTSIQEENPEFVERLKAMNPLHKIGKPEDLAGISILLSSKASDFITGQNFVIDGGWTIW